MPRLMINDATETDPRALIQVANWISALNPLPSDQYLRASGDAQLTLVANCILDVNGGIFGTNLTTLSAANLDTGTNFQAGSDYYVYICDPDPVNLGNEAFRISLNSTFPQGFSDLTSRKIGGFHFGQCRRVDNLMRPINSDGAVYGTGWESNVYLGIAPQSVWTLKHRPKASPEGMVYVGDGLWMDIYLNSDDGAGGIRSAFGAIPLSGTEGFNWYSFNDRALMNGKRLPSYAEWLRAAYGSPQGNDGDNVNAWSATTNTARTNAGNVANAVSSVGIRDAVGNLWEWLDEFITRESGRVLSGTTNPTSFTYASYDGGRAGQTITNGSGHGPTTRSDVSPNSAQGAYAWDRISPLGDTTNGNPNNGNIFQYFDQSLVALSAGGSWIDGSRAGCRAVLLHHFPWIVHTHRGARCASDSL